MDGSRNPENDPGFIIKQIDTSIKRRIDERLAKYDLTAQQSRVLLFLVHQKGHRASQREIEKFLQVTHPTVVGVVCRLEEKGFVTTSAGAEDKRLTMVELSERSGRLFAGMEKGRIDLERQMYQGVSAEEKEELLRLLKKIRNNLREETLAC